MRVLVTRPEPGAGRTAQRLQALGHMPVLLPLTEVLRLPAVLPPEARDPAAVVITSANALRFADPALLAPLVDKPCFAVGQRTADLARSLGFHEVVAGPGDAEGLGRLIVRSTETAATLAYLCGRLRRDALERELEAAGCRCVAIETYDTRDVSYTREKLRAALGTEPIDALLLYSPHAAERLAVLWGAMAECAGSATIICISRRTADVAAAIGGLSVLAAPEPHEDAMFALLCNAATRLASDPSLNGRV